MCSQGLIAGIPPRAQHREADRNADLPVFPNYRPICILKAEA